MDSITRTNITWLVLMCYSVTSAIRVCPRLHDYNLWFSRNTGCFDNPASEQNITNIIENWGLTAEEHYLTTEDGYKILVERVYGKITKPSPIIIVHGISMSALGWVIRGKGSLAYLLAHQGYDVWMVNYRGTWYSKNHIKYKSNSNQFWKFSIHEMGIYDIRTSIKHVNKITKKQAIYIGYSMGSTGFFIYSTTFPDEAKTYVKGMIGLAPVINYKDIKSYVKYVVPIWPILKNLVYFFWGGEVFPGFSMILRPLASSSLGILFMQMFVNAAFGDDTEQLDPITYPLFVSQLVDTMGAEVFTHYIQLYQSGRFQNYDYGEKENLKKYGSSKPPAYKLSKVPVPVALFVGENDWLATITNAKQLYSELSPSFRCGYHPVPEEKWNHIDFLIAKDLEKYLYKDLFRKIEQIDSGKCAP